MSERERERERKYKHYTFQHHQKVNIIRNLTFSIKHDVSNIEVIDFREEKLYTKHE